MPINFRWFIFIAIDVFIEVVYNVIIFRCFKIELYIYKTKPYFINYVHYAIILDVNTILILMLYIQTYYSLIKEIHESRQIRSGQTGQGKSERRHSRNQPTKMDWNGWI